MEKVYITTTLPYVNADPHIGFALEIIQADAFARLNSQIGNKVFFNTGTDEHGLKIYRKAEDAGKDPQKYVDEYAAKFDDLKKALNLSYNNFIRTTDPDHKKAAQEFWKLCDKNGDIYKKLYKIKYCVGCELEKTDSELVDGKCPIHPTYELEIIEEENYFFKFSKYTDKLLELYESNPDFVIPDFRLKEIKTFVKDGLNDFSISRLKEKMPWGVEVPGDPEQVMYVWFDALINYISAIGWPEEKSFEKWWPVIQFAGKDNLRQQSAIWQAMLLSAGIEPSKQIVIHGFITSDGQKMSKSIGNVIDPYELVSKYGTDATRYYLLAKMNPFEDSDFTYQKFEEVYNGELANGIGNLVARVAAMTEKEEVKAEQASKISPSDIVISQTRDYRYDKALDLIWKQISEADSYINSNEVWALEGKEKEEALLHLVDEIRQIAVDLQPFMPETTKKIQEQFKGPEIKKSDPLFPRLE